MEEVTSEQRLEGGVGQCTGQRGSKGQGLEVGACWVSSRRSGRSTVEGTRGVVEVGPGRQPNTSCKALKAWDWLWILFRVK